MMDPSKFRFNKVKRHTWDDPDLGKRITVGREKVDDRAWWDMKRKEGLRAMGDYDKDGVLNIFDRYPRDKKRR